MLQSAIVNLALSIGVMHYESNIYSEHFRSFLKKDIRPNYFPFLIHGNTLLCPRIYREFIISGRPRNKAAIEMIHTGLEMSQRDNTNLDLARRKKKRRDLLPILIVNRDESGCNTTTHVDDYDFPRLTWSVPALKHHMEWCQAVPMPSYEIWRDYSKKHTSGASWDDTFALESKQYPWNNKTNVALWRGTTTYDYNYTGVELNKTPRGRLVQISMKHPALIDAGFVRLNQQFENATFTKENATILTDRMKFDDMMKYKAIIDIDGNDWSSRFPKLLCMNSVVIKVCGYVSCERIVFDGIKDPNAHLRRINFIQIEPDYIEYFYHELQPMVHFVPASLENLTQVAAYVLDRQNDEEMRSIVDSANSWCRAKMIKESLAKDMMSQIEAYETMLNDYLLVKNITDESLASSLLQYSDFVPCF